MTMTVMSERKPLVVRPDTVVALPRHVQLKFDKLREMWLLLAPERILTPDDIAVRVLQLCDGTRSVHQVCEVLAEIYAAPIDRIEADVIVMVQDCPSSGDLEHERLISNGGSGSMGFQSMPLSGGAASGASRWSLL
jgi:pyrroloquinoline quinone biosynthesis protein D